MFEMVFSQEHKVEFETLEAMIGAAREILKGDNTKPVVSLFAPDYAVGSIATNWYGDYVLTWRKKRDLDYVECYCEECGGSVGADGRCTVCGEQDMIICRDYFWENHREVRTEV